ncbi:MAG TPA: MATE family efflux transporter [Devosia sp.]
MSRPTFPFDVKSRDVWRIALPASIAFITEPLAGLNDITVIGRLGDAALLGGLVLGALAFDFIFSMAYFLRTGTAGLTAQAIGARDPRDGFVHFGRAAAAAFLIGLAMIVLAGPLLTIANFALAPPTAAVADALAQYFHVRIWSAPFSLVNYALLGWYYGRGRARTGMLLQLVIHLANIALSILFVYGFGWGIFGAALGTVLGQVAAAALGLALVVRHFGGLKSMLPLIHPTELLDPVGLRRMVGLSRDLMLRSIALMGAYAFFAAQGSRMGEVALSANAILLNFLMISGFFLDGMAQAAEALCGKAVGANHRPAYEQAYALSMRWGFVISAGLALVWFVFGAFVIEFMTTSEPVRAYARDFLWIAALSPLTGMPAFVYDGILIGSTLNVTMRNGMIASLAVFLAAALALQPVFGNTGLWLAIHIFFIARAAYYWQALDRRKAGLFA